MGMVHDSYISTSFGWYQKYITSSSLFCSLTSLLLLSWALPLLLLLFKILGDIFVSADGDCPWSDTLRVFVDWWIFDRLVGRVPSVLFKRYRSGIFGYVLVLRSWEKFIIYWNAIKNIQMNNFTLLLDFPIVVTILVAESPLGCFLFLNDLESWMSNENENELNSVHQNSRKSQLPFYLQVLKVAFVPHQMVMWLWEQQIR